MEKLKITDISIDVIRKDIKNIHLSVYPPDAKVRISAPKRIRLETIKMFAISKIGWIRKQQHKIKSQKRELPGEYINRESHYFRGQRYLLKIIEHRARPEVVLTHSNIELYIRPGTLTLRRKFILDEWYRKKLKQEIASLIKKWEKILNVKIAEFGIKRMKTRWGTCNSKAKRIWLNLELAKKPPQCLEYIVVHEMLHLLERKHNNRFVSLMDRFMPNWRYYKEELNRLPIIYSQWKY